MARYFADRNTKFVNPYHFVRIEREKLNRMAFDEVRNYGTLTGFIECDLTTLTPLFIPNTTNDNVFDFKDQNGKPLKSYDFYSYADLSGKTNPEALEPVIPGSSIRGVLRSVYEAITNSCLSTTNVRQVLFKRSPIIFDKAGLLYSENGRWFIQKAKVYDIKINELPDDYAEGDEVVVRVNERKGNSRAQAFLERYVKEDEEEENLEPGQRIGYLHITEKENKNYEKVFILNYDEDPIEVDERAVWNLLENYRLYRKETINNKLKEGTHGGYEGKKFVEINPDKLNDADNLLVYFKEVEGQIYLSPSPLGREVYYNTMEEILEKHVACNSIDSLCPACRLFGFVGSSDALSSRIRVTDALLREKTVSYNELFEKPFILKELSSPKITSTEFYVKKPSKDADFWNYDYWVQWKRQNENGKIKIKGKAEKKVSYTPEIKGRKFYWHHPQFDVSLIKEATGTERNVGIRPIKSGISFSFRIYFNHITEEELNNLLWVLELGLHDKKAHKIGMGKPYGLGSVKIRVNQIRLRKVSLKEDKIIYRFEEMDKPDYKEWEENFEKGILEDLMVITDFENGLKNIRYPYVIPNEGSHVWFMEARKEKGTGVAPVLTQILDDIKNPFLYTYRRK